MKRYWLLNAVAVLVIGYLFIKNENYRNELKQTENKISQLELSEEIIHIEAGEVAEKFILAYFNFQGKPLEKSVEMYVTKDVLKELNFESNEEYDEFISDINSNVSNLDVYLGEFVQEKQKVLGVFVNQIDLGNTESKVNSFIELDLENIGGEWRIVDFNFFQY
ncbi:hypothetical protein [Oceanobacillus polygoni]|uniref:Uncharacterized protein n=1 Tax=Oceanobacillus polygoni TaxID=1235259 RepID=A0A9X0Z0R4_9BACI|nr:hypothetical protein [Oceanobacillus polygoni]MBP2079775.1 hypothetical protein [Oceanobacillus polygoni]